MRTTILTMMSLLLFSVSHFAYGQNKSGEDPAVSAEEKLIRAAYEKLVLYNRAAVLDKLQGKYSLLTPDLVLQFDLKNFHTGPIEEIKGKVEGDIVTLPSGDVVEVTRANHSLNNGPLEASYSASWNVAPELSETRHTLTVGEVFQLLGNEYLDVRKYTTYEVIVTFEGKSRHYRALLLVHEDVRKQPRLEFWDRIGAGGVLSRIHVENLPLWRSIYK